MLKKIIKRFATGFIIEVFVTYLITIINSVLIGDGTYYFVTPGLLKTCSTTLNAVVLQFFLAGFLGAVMGVSSIIWEIDKWSLTLQTVVHFLVITISMLIIAYLCYWMPHSVKGFVFWISMFIIIYIIIWIICYSNYKHKINQINKTLSEKGNK